METFFTMPTNNSLHNSRKFRYHSQALIDTGPYFNEVPNSHVSSYQLASKLKQIKNNLDNNNFSNEINSTSFNRPTSLNNTFSIFSMASPNISANTSSVNFSDKNDRAYNPQSSSAVFSTRPFSSAQQFIDSLSPSPIYSPNHRQVSSRMSNSRTPDSMSQVLNINLKKFEFEMDTANSKSSIDFILDQIHENKQNEPPTNKKTHKKLPKDKTTNLVNLNQASLVDNISRQSSIRSLFSNVDSTILNGPNQSKTKKTSSMATSAKAASSANLSSNFMGSSISSNGSLAKIVNGLNKKDYVSSNLSCQNLNIVKENEPSQPTLLQNEIDLLNDWDTFKSDDAAYANSSIISSSENSTATASSSKTDLQIPENFPNTNRPDTRMGFIDNDNDNQCSVDYSDNITVRSSASSLKFYPDECASEDCSLLTTPRNGPFEYYNSNTNKINVATKRPESRASVLSNFISDLKFEDGFCAAAKANSNKLDLTNKPNDQNISDNDGGGDENDYYDYEAVSEICVSDTMSILNGKSKSHRNMRGEDPSEKHQRLSHSINNLFSNLLHQLETNKNKTYLNTNKLSSPTNILNEESILNNLKDKTLLSYEQLNNSNPVGKKQALSKDSNKDSGFNQEFINDKFYRNKYYGSKHRHEQNEYENEINLDQCLKNNNNDEISLLERYLNNEQLVAYKHSQLEAYLSKVYQVSFSNDFGMLDYMLNQEGLSKTTFKKLIREKFGNFEWTNVVLMNLHEIINQKMDVSINTDQNLDGGFNDDFEILLDQENDRTYQSLDQENQSNNKNQSTSPSSSSSVSFKKLKDIKALSSQSKKRNSEKKLNTTEVSLNEIAEPSDENSVPQNLIVDLKNTFVQRRQRKGSLPEIHFQNGQLNDTTLVLSNSGCTQEVICDNESTKTFRTRARSSIATCKRMSRRSAFVLDPMRTSMFRSKSLTDLNNTLVKTNVNLDKSEINLNNLEMNNHSIIENLNNSTLNLSRNGTSTDDSPLVRVNHNLDNNYSGVIWQCADMIYEEFKNKYEELRWLMNGDNLSAAAKLKEVEQRLKIETTLKEKNMVLYDEIGTKGRNKDVMGRLKSQLTVINQKIKELELIKLYIRICEINAHGLDNNNLHDFFNNAMQFNLIRDSEKPDKQNLLQGKTYNEILKSLYGCEAIGDGFIYQFLVIYRYMFSSVELFEFFKDNFDKAFTIYNTHKLKKFLILDRTIDLIAMWIDGFYVTDFQQNETLFDLIDSFINNEINTYDQNKSRTLSNLLRNPKIEFNLFANKKSLTMNRSINKVSKQVQKATALDTSKSSTLRKRIFNSKNMKRSKSTDHLTNSEENTTISLNCSTLSRLQNFSVNDYTNDMIASQLTLIEWDNFLDIHVCHCLNSKAQGVNCDSKQPIDPQSINSVQCLFIDNYLCKSLYKMIQFSYVVRHWVSAEVLMVDNYKIQADLIVKFLKVAKKCYDLSNFSTAFSIFDGLQDISVKNLKSWQYISNKNLQILEKISSYKLIFQNEPFLINQLVKTTNKPVIPNMHLFLLTVQQNELGSFQLANGQWKWSKLSYLAKLVDQIRVVQQHYVYDLEPNDDFVEELLSRIYYFKDSDLNQLAEYNSMQANSRNQKLNITSTSIKSLMPRKR